MMRKRVVAAPRAPAGLPPAKRRRILNAEDVGRTVVPSSAPSRTRTIPPAANPKHPLAGDRKRTSPPSDADDRRSTVVEVSGSLDSLPNSEAALVAVRPPIKRVATKRNKQPAPGSSSNSPGGTTCVDDGGQPIRARKARLQRKSRRKNMYEDNRRTRWHAVPTCCRKQC
jgi:hypothetical protein